MFGRKSTQRLDTFISLHIFTYYYTNSEPIIALPKSHEKAGSV